MLITWGCCCSLVFNLVSDWNMVVGCCLRLCRSNSRSWLCSIDFRFFVVFNLDDDMTNWNDIVVAKVDGGDRACGCGWNLGD